MVIKLSILNSNPEGNALAVPHQPFNTASSYKCAVSLLLPMRIACPSQERHGS